MAHLLQRYKDSVGRIISTFKDNGKYSINITMLDANGNSMLNNGVAMVSYTFLNREAYRAALTRYPRKQNLK